MVRSSRLKRRAQRLWAGSPSGNSASQTSYNPALYVGPFTRWCEGETWVTPSVTETIISDPGGTSSGPSVPWEGVVESTSEMVTTEAGTFDCACSRTELTGGPDVGGWTRQCVSKDLGVLIREEIHAPGAGGDVIGFFEAISID